MSLACSPLTMFRLLLLVLVLAGVGGCASSPGLQPGERSLLPPLDQAEAVAGDTNAVVEQLWQVFARYEGVPYRYGGTGAGGFDCSGFIMTAYREALGLRLPRTTEALLAHGRDIPRDAVRPGDLVFFRIGGKDSHAGIYMGQHRFIHSASSSGVSLSSLRQEYWRERYSRARRFD